MSTMRRNDWPALLEKGRSLLQQGRPREALKQLELAVRQAPGERQVRYWLANAYRMNGDVLRARKIFQKLLAERPEDFDASFALAFLLRDAGAPIEAAEALLKAAGQPSVTLEQRLQLAGFLRDSNQFDAAIAILEKAVELCPERPDLYFKLGRLYQDTGAFDRALEALRKTLELAPSTGPAWTLLVQQKRFSSTDDTDFIRLKAAAGESHGSEADMCIAFALGKALDDLQQWPGAWEQYQKGNRLKAKTLPWSQSGWRRFVERSIANTVNSDNGAPGSVRKAVFIVGMPRSGTTLLESMLDRHANITGRGELNFLADLARQRSTLGQISGSQRRELADFLWAQLRLNGPEDGLYIDKNPLNFRYLDLIFELLPTARVLHVVRDGRDSCLSCYFQLFAHDDTAFSNNLDNLVAFYSGYRDLMAHWEQVYADRIHRVRYEALVQSAKQELSGVLEFLDTKWDDALTQAPAGRQLIRTASVWQARQPVYSDSLQRWRSYYPQAPEFFDSLAAIDSAHEPQS